MTLTFRLHRWPVWSMLFGNPNTTSAGKCCISWQGYLVDDNLFLPRLLSMASLTSSRPQELRECQHTASNHTDSMRYSPNGACRHEASQAHRCVWSSSEHNAERIWKSWKVRKCDIKNIKRHGYLCNTNTIHWVNLGLWKETFLAFKCISAHIIPRLESTVMFILEKGGTGIWVSVMHFSQQKWNAILLFYASFWPLMLLNRKQYYYYLNIMMGHICIMEFVDDLWTPAWSVSYMQL